MTNNQNNNINEEVSSYSIREFFHLARKHIKKTILITSIIFLATIIFTFIIKPQYHSDSTIMITKESSSAMSFLELNLGSDMNYIANEIEIIKSRTTSELVIRELLESEHRDN